MVLTALPSKEKKKVLNAIASQWGCDPKEIVVFKGGVLADHLFFESEKGRIFIAAPSVREIDVSELRVNNLGIYFCRFLDRQIRLSIEGAQIIGPYAKQNIIEILDEEAKQWIQGEDLEKGGEEGFFILKNNTDFIGCGRRSEGKIHNFVPKVRRTH